MRSIHGLKTKSDKLDSWKIAQLLRGGNFPCAYVYPRRFRATRDLLRRRLHFVRFRSELLTHLKMSEAQTNLEGAAGPSDGCECETTSMPDTRPARRQARRKSSQSSILVRADHCER